MADDKQRSDLIDAINQAFNAGNIGATSAQLGTLSPQDDALSIVDKLGFLTPIHGGNLPAYRGVVGIPMLHQHVLTAAFRTALQNQPAPVPLQFDIVNGQAEGVSVSTTPAGISIVLTRLPRGPAPAPSPPPSP